jgi:hypothetical protein
VNWSADDVAEVPTVFVMVMSTVPADSAGLVAVICVPELTVKVVAAVAPNLTAVAPVKLVPVIVTELAPATGPAVGLTEVTAGEVTYVNWSAPLVADVPEGVVTVIFTVPATPAGLIAVIEVADTTA